MPESIIDNRYFPELPIQIDANTTLDINFITILSIDSQVFDYIETNEYYSGEWNNPNWDPISDGYKPIKMSYSLILASGQNILAKDIPCYLVKYKLTLPDSIEVK
jgi:hypothetical protein